MNMSSCLTNIPSRHGRCCRCRGCVVVKITLSIKLTSFLFGLA
ncbi:predicted protein [Plenodomus lingam JN3]|uniref:Predicted protein n=1 Tax=Leptosphaeria maculans (strain JN3 / isolate v23.1.3 / race Av1-4-5-6-7-8) TaxID=985895 RepID=E4ZSC0_LEPMJ|nr:predicted protein [Plenodomus lingam JN3]CBX94300.1 predicted protein [Plenodomus lingam JN3]